MGKKNRRSGVIWSQEAGSGTPLGRDILEWDGVSRTTKRNQKKSLINQRKDMFLSCTHITEDKLEKVVSMIKETWVDLNQEQRQEFEFCLEDVMDHLETVRNMKKGGAKQRLIKHIIATLSEDEWSMLEKLRAYHTELNHE